MTVSQSREAQMSSMQALPETADIETSSEGYARRFSGPAGTWFLQVQEQALARMLEGAAGMSVLDVGGGHGQLTGRLVTLGCKVTVLGSAESCSARLRPWLQNGRCSFKTGNVVGLPFSDRSFDVVTCFRLLPHVVQWENLIAELCRAARCAVIADFPARRSLNAATPLLFGLKKKMEGNTRNYKCFRERDLIHVFARHGFKRGARCAQFFLPMVVHRLLGSAVVSKTLEAPLQALGLTALFGSPVILKMVRESPA